MKQLYKREFYLNKMRGFYDDDEIIKVITGVRRCGKSSLMEIICDELRDRGVNESNIIYIHLDKRPYKSLKHADELERLIDDRCSCISGMKYLFIDEVQNISSFEEVINAFREEGDYSIFITGSNSYLLSGDLATKLTGRYIEFEVSTLSFNEYVGMKRFYGMEISDNIEDEFDRYILEGGFPHAVKLQQFSDKRIYVKSVIDEIYKKDIAKNKVIRNKELFERIKTFIINNFGSTMSISHLGQYLAKTTGTPVRKETIYRYISILEDTKIISKCRRFDQKSKRSLNGDEKYYLTDLSFYFCNNTDNRIEYGPVLENIVYNYARSLGYDISVGRIGKLEIDFIMRDISGDYSYIQVARYLDNGNVDENGVNLTEEREYRPLESIRDSYSKYVLTMDRLLQKRNGIKHENLIRFISREAHF